VQTATPTGNLTVLDHREAIRRLEAEINSGEDLLIDLKEVGEVDSVTLALLIGIVRRMHFNGRSVRFSNLPEQMRKLIDLYEAGEFFREGAQA